MTSKLQSMAAFVFLLFFSAVSAQLRASHISPGSSLSPTTNSTWFSHSGLYAFGFFPQDNGYAVGIFLAGISGNTVVWTANTNSPTVPNDAVLQLTRDGRFVMRQTGQQEVQIANPPVGITSASMLDSGNFVLYGNNSTIIWQSFDHPTNTLLPGQRLRAGDELFSSATDNDYTRGFFRLSMQTDGNLVGYPVAVPVSIRQARDAYYASNTFNAGNNVSLNLEDDGYLYLLNGSSILMNFTEGYPVENNTIYLMRIDVDGIFRLYSHPLTREGNWSMRWSPGLNQCDVKGACGFNSFCFLMDDSSDCKCLQGFDSIQPGNKTAGCARNFDEGSCNKDSKVQLEIRKEANTVWDDNPYDFLDAISEEGCIKACQDDCNCDAAIFKDGQCRKQRLPLRYGRRVQGDSGMTLVKVQVGIPTSTPDAAGVPSNSTKESKKQFRYILGISVTLFIAAVLFTAISVIYVHRKHRAYNYNKITQNREATPDQDASPKAFNFADLAEATNDFVEEIGKGASGTVFKGILPGSQKVVAVKRIEKECGGEKEFRTEMKTIGKTYHRNLVRLLGYCLNGPNRLLVFEYMDNGSLADILCNPDKRPSWEDRINIARDVARGILYLHEECETQIMHCDIKSQNILLDEHGCAKISDFGLAKLLNHDQTHTNTGIRGTKGYVAPEWHQKKAVTVKADVYSYGIVLLEIICCRKCINWSLSEDEAVLEEWVYDRYVAGELGNLVENEIVDNRKLERVVKIGLWCIQEEPSLRPSMKKVLLMLEGTVDIPVPPNPTSFLSSTS